MEPINPRVDIMFKKIFGNEENKDILISLINSIVSSADKIIDLTLLTTYNLHNYIEDKLSTLDVEACGVDGKKFNIEIQITDEADYNRKDIYDWGWRYTEKLQKSENYSQLSKAISIHILHFFSIPGVPQYHNVFHITKQDGGLSYFRDLELHTIELNKFTRSVSEWWTVDEAKVEKSIDMWSAFLIRSDLLRSDELPATFDGDSLKKALTILDEMRLSREEKEIYEGQLKWLRAKESCIKKAYADAFELGRAQGMAKNLLASGVGLETIAAASDLSLAELERLRG